MVQLSLFQLEEDHQAERSQSYTYTKTVSSGDVKCLGDSFLYRLWIDIRREWFPRRPDIDDYHVFWSKRPQKRTLASCNVWKGQILVAKELRNPEYHIWLSPLLYHEMCHAVLGTSVENRGRMQWHGPHFRKLERRHPGIRALDEWIKSGGWSAAIKRDRLSKEVKKTIS